MFKTKKMIEINKNWFYMVPCPKSHVPVGVRWFSNGEINRYGTWN